MILNHIHVTVIVVPASRAKVTEINEDGGAGVFHLQ